MNRSKLALGIATAASAVSFAGERPASACGGCFHPPSQTVTDITDERMLLAVSSTQSTLYDQITVLRIAVVVCVGAAHPRHGDRGPERRRAVRLDRRADGDADQSSAAELPVAELQLPNTAPTAAFGRGRRRSGASRAGARASERGPLRHRPAPLERLERARRVADRERLQHPRGRAADPRRLRQGGLRLSRDEAPAQSGRPGHAPGARDDHRRLVQPAAAHGVRRHGRRDGHHDLGGRRRPLRAAELPVLSHRRQPARLGLEHQRQQLHDAARAERGEAEERRMGDRELDRPQPADDQERDPERRPVLRKRPGLERPFRPDAGLSAGRESGRGGQPATQATRAPSRCATTTSARSSRGSPARPSGSRASGATSRRRR